MLYIEGNDLHDCWVNLNKQFTRIDPYAGGMYVPNRDYTRIMWPVRMHTTGGFGFDSTFDEYSELPGFYADYPRRIKLLANRYLDQELWDEGIGRLQARSKRFQLKNPMSFVIQFHRRATTERKVPAGGGCMTNITLIWINGSWKLHVFLRASEVTAALMGDIAFVEWLIHKVQSEVRLKHFDRENLEIVWDIDLASQMKAIVPLYWIYTYGDEGVFHEMFRDPITLNEWQLNIVKYFWNIFIFPEYITWNRRKRWSEKFLDVSEIDWRLAKEKYEKEYGIENL